MELFYMFSESIWTCSTAGFTCIWVQQPVFLHFITQNGSTATSDTKMFQIFMINIGRFRTTGCFKVIFSSIYWWKFDVDKNIYALNAAAFFHLQGPKGCVAATNRNYFNCGKLSKNHENINYKTHQLCCLIKLAEC